MGEPERGRLRGYSGAAYVLSRRMPEYLVYDAGAVEAGDH